MELHENNLPKESLNSNEAEYLSDFCRARGARFFVVRDSFWMSRGMRFFSPWPSSWPIAVSPEDLQFMWKQGAWFLHYASSEDKPFYLGYDLVVDDRSYDLGSIRSANRRHNIRRGIKCCSVERVSFDLFVRDAGPLIEDTMKRQGRVFNQDVVEMWQNYHRLAASNPLFEAWASLISNQLAAMCVLIVVGVRAYIETTFSRSDLLAYHPVDALVFAVTKLAISRDNVTHVSYGKRPIIGEPETLVSFKESMGFRKTPLKERIEVHPFLRPFLHKPLRSLVGIAATRASDRSMYARIISGVIDTHQGQVHRDEIE